MKYLSLGSSKLRVSQVAVGFMRHKSDTPDIPRAEKLVETALECGVNFFDNAEVYQTEDTFRLAAHTDIPSRRERLVIQSKGGMSLMPGGEGGYSTRYMENTKERILSGVDGILRRLGTEYLDSYLIHRPDALMEPEGIAEAFEKLRAGGKVRHFGVSNFPPDTMRLLSAYVDEPIVANQVQFGLFNSSMIDACFNCNRKNKFGADYDNGLLDYCRLHHITIQTWGSFQGGWFLSPFIESPEYPEVNACLEHYAQAKGVSKTAVYTAWLLRHPAKMQLLAGTTNADRLRDICRGADIEISHDEWYHIYLSAGKIIA